MPPAGGVSVKHKGTLIVERAKTKKDICASKIKNFLLTEPAPQSDNHQTPHP